MEGTNGAWATAWGGSREGTRGAQASKFQVMRVQSMALSEDESVAFAITPGFPAPGVHTFIIC